MNKEQEILKQVRAALERDPYVNLHHDAIHLSLNDGMLTLEGEVEDISAKKAALERAACISGVDGIIDRLRVRPARSIGDGAVRVIVLKSLMQEPAFQDMHFEVEILDGVITLNGRVPSLSHKRLAGVLAWWTPGCRDVVNGIEVMPPQEDNDEELADAVRLVLEKDPFVRADQIRVFARDNVVTLAGATANTTERKMAERDVWYVFGVDGVDNRLDVLK